MSRFYRHQGKNQIYIDNILTHSRFNNSSLYIIHIIHNFLAFTKISFLTNMALNNSEEVIGTSFFLDQV